MSKPSWEEFRDSFVESIKSGSSVQQATERAASLPDVSAQNEQGVKTITPPRVTGTNAQTPSVEWRDHYQKQAQKAVDDNFRKSLNVKWADFNYEQSQKQQKQLDKIRKSDVVDVNATINSYKKAMDEAAKAEDRKDKLNKGNPYEAALVGGIYDKDISDAKKQAEDLKKALAEYGIEVDGNLVDANNYYTTFFDNLKGYAVENKAPSVYLPKNGLFSDSTSFDVNEDISHIAKDEMQLYNYLAARDKETAEIYKTYLNNLVAQRKGGARAEEVLDKYTPGGVVLSRGVEAFKSGLAGTYNAAAATATGNDMKTSASQYAADALRADLQEQGKNTVFFDAAQSVGGMLPGVVAGMANPTAGAAVFGATSAAGAMQEKLAEGWNKQDAMTYGVLVGASEAALGKVLGGIPALGGKAGGIASKLLPKINNALAKVAVTATGQALSEAGEEAVQTFIEPAIVSLITGVNFDAPNADEVIYNAIIGAITSAGFSAPNAAVEIASAKGSRAAPEAAVETAPAETEAEAARRIIDELTGVFTPAAKQATESQNKPAEVQGVQVAPEASQDAEQTAPERLNLQALQEGRANVTINETTVSQENDELRTGVSDRMSDFTTRQIEKFRTKPAIKTSAKDLAKVNSARVDRYRSLDESEIPALDALPIAEYGEVNTGYRYIVRNSGRDSFEVIGKYKIKDNSDIREELGNVTSRTAEAPRDNQAVNQEITQPVRGQDSGNNRPSGQSGTDGTVSDVAGSSAEARISERADERIGDSGSAVRQPAPSRHKATDEAEYAEIALDRQREEENEQVEYLELRDSDKRTTNAQEYAKKQAEAEAAAPKFVVEETFGKELGRISKAAEKAKSALPELESKESRDTRDKDAVAISELLTKLVNGEANIREVSNAYNDLGIGKGRAIYSKDIADALQSAASGAEKMGNEFDGATAESVAKNTAYAVERIAHEIELEAKSKATMDALKKEAPSAKAKKARKNAKLEDVKAGAVSIQLTPDTLFKKLGGFVKGSKGYELAGKAFKSDVTAKTENTAGLNFFADVRSKAGYKDFANGKLMAQYKTENGEQITAQEAVSALMALRSAREEMGGKFATIGSIYVERDGKQLYLYTRGKNREANADNLSILEAELEDALPDVAKDYMKSMNDMFSYYSPKLRDAVMKSKGITADMVEDGKYFPLFWDADVKKNWDVSAAVRSGIDNLGIIQERSHESGGHLKIVPVSVVADSYISNASHYIGWAEFASEMDMLNRNVDGSGGISQLMADAFGDDYGGVMQRYVKDLNEYRDNNSDDPVTRAIRKLRGNMARGILVGKLTTALSQPSSVWAAVGIIKPQAVMKARYTIDGITKKHVNLDDPLIKNRANGNIDPALSDALKDGSKTIQRIMDETPVLKQLYKSMPFMDLRATKQLYAACWYNVEMDNPDVKTDSAEFKQMVENKFAEALMFSQSNAEMLSNAEIIRTKNELVKTIAMFRGQPTMQFNMMYTAMGEYMAAKGTSGEKAAKEKAKTVIAGQLGASFSYAFLKVAAQILVHKLYSGRDEDDELSAKKFAEAIASEGLATFAGTVWLGDNIANWAMNALSDGEFGSDFDVSSGVVTAMNDAVKSVFDLAGEVTKGELKATTVKNAALNISEVFGLPLQSTYEALNGIVMWSRDISAGEISPIDDIIKLIEKQQKEEAKAEEDAIDMLINAGKSTEDSVETVYGKTALEIEALNDSIDTYKKERTHEYDTEGDHAIVKLILDAGLTDDGIDAMIAENTTKPYRADYNVLRDLGLEPEEAASKYSELDSDANAYLKQAELKETYKQDPEIEYIIEAIWNSKGWAKSWNEAKPK